jgi:hypothetical protein
MDRPWLGFLEMFIVLMFALGWGVVELVALRLDRKKREAAAQRKVAGEQAPPDVSD